MKQNETKVSCTNPMTTQVHDNLNTIHDEDTLRLMWQQAEDFDRRKEIRLRMYKLREERLKSYYTIRHETKGDSSNDVTNSKSISASLHADSLNDQGFMSLKTEEIRDSISPMSGRRNTFNQGETTTAIENQQSQYVSQYLQDKQLSETSSSTTMVATGNTADEYYSIAPGISAMSKQIQTVIQSNKNFDTNITDDNTSHQSTMQTKDLLVNQHPYFKNSINLTNKIENLVQKQCCKEQNVKDYVTAETIGVHSVDHHSKLKSEHQNKIQDKNKMIETLIKTRMQEGCANYIPEKSNACNVAEKNNAQMSIINTEICATNLNHCDTVILESEQVSSINRISQDLSATHNAFASSLRASSVSPTPSTGAGTNTNVLRSSMSKLSSERSSPEKMCTPRVSPDKQTDNVVFNRHCEEEHLSKKLTASFQNRLVANGIYQPMMYNNNQAQTLSKEKNRRHASLQYHQANNNFKAMDFEERNSTDKQSQQVCTGQKLKQQHLGRKYEKSTRRSLTTSYGNDNLVRKKTISTQASSRRQSYPPQKFDAKIGHVISAVNDKKKTNMMNQVCITQKLQQDTISKNYRDQAAAPGNAAATTGGQTTSYRPLNTVYKGPSNEKHLHTSTSINKPNKLTLIQSPKLQKSHAKKVQHTAEINQPLQPQSSTGSKLRIYKSATSPVSNRKEVVKQSKLGKQTDIGSDSDSVSTTSTSSEFSNDTDTENVTEQSGVTIEEIVDTDHKQALTTTFPSIQQATINKETNKRNTGEYTNIVEEIHNKKKNINNEALEETAKSSVLSIQAPVLQGTNENMSDIEHQIKSFEQIDEEQNTSISGQPSQFELIKEERIKNTKEDEMKEQKISKEGETDGSIPPVQVVLGEEAAKLFEQQERCQLIQSQSQLQQPICTPIEANFSQQLQQISAIAIAPLANRVNPKTKKDDRFNSQQMQKEHIRRLHLTSKKLYNSNTQTNATTIQRKKKDNLQNLSTNSESKAIITAPLQLQHACITKNQKEKKRKLCSPSESVPIQIVRKSINTNKHIISHHLDHKLQDGLQDGNREYQQLESNKNQILTKPSTSTTLQRLQSSTIDIVDAGTKKAKLNKSSSLLKNSHPSKKTSGLKSNTTYMSTIQPLLLPNTGGLKNKGQSKSKLINAKRHLTKFGVTTQLSSKQKYTNKTTSPVGQQQSCQKPQNTKVDVKTSKTKSKHCTGGNLKTITNPKFANQKTDSLKPKQLSNKLRSVASYSANKKIVSVENDVAMETKMADLQQQHHLHRTAEAQLLSSLSPSINKISSSKSIKQCKERSVSTKVNDFEIYGGNDKQSARYADSVVEMDDLVSLSKITVPTFEKIEQLEEDQHNVVEPSQQSSLKISVSPQTINASIPPGIDQFLDTSEITKEPTTLRDDYNDANQNVQQTKRFFESVATRKSGKSPAEAAVNQSIPHKIVSRKMSENAYEMLVQKPAIDVSPTPAALAKIKTKPTPIEITTIEIKPSTQFDHTAIIKFDEIKQSPSLIKQQQQQQQCSRSNKSPSPSKDGHLLSTHEQEWKQSSSKMLSRETSPTKSKYLTPQSTNNIEEISDLELLRIMLEEATRYDIRSKIRAQIRSIVRQTELKRKKSPPDSRCVSPEKRPIPAFLSTNGTTSAADRRDKVKKRLFETDGATTSRTTNNVASSCDMNTSSTASSQSVCGTTIGTNTSTQHTHVNTKQECYTATSKWQSRSIISGYGTGPTDENGKVLFGLRALRNLNRLKPISADSGNRVTARTKNNADSTDCITDNSGRALFGLKAIQRNVAVVALTQPDFSATTECEENCDPRRLPLQSHIENRLVSTTTKEYTSASNIIARSNTSSSASVSVSAKSNSTSSGRIAKAISVTSPFAKFRQLEKQNSLPSFVTAAIAANANAGTGAGTRAESKFADSNSKLTRSSCSIKDRLLDWVKAQTKDYKNVQIDNFSSSWNNGLAFCALIHHFHPYAFDYDKLTPQQRRFNFELAFRVAEQEAGIVPLLDVDDMVTMKRPDWKCVFTYVQTIYQRFHACPGGHEANANKP